MEARFRVMKAFAHEFEKRGLPFIAVIHAPDEHNHDQNWHMHLAYWDRPCRKINQDDIDGLTAKGFDTRQLRPGMWDVTCAVHKFNRPNRKSFPLRQNKVAEINREKGWPKYLRRKFAQCVNEELELIGSQMRFDPRKYEDMDIPAVPQEHLGPSEHAREVKGDITERGISNEQKQWDFIMAKLTADHERDLARIEEELASLMQGLAQHHQAQDIEKLFRAALEKTAHERYQANVAEEKLEREASRARFIRDRNLKMLKAYDAGTSKMSHKAAQESRDLVRQSSAYLDNLEHKQKPKREEIAEIRRMCDNRVLPLNGVARRYREDLARMQQQAQVVQQRSVASLSGQSSERAMSQQPLVKPGIPATGQTVAPPAAVNQARTAQPPVDRNPATTEPVRDPRPSESRQGSAGPNAGNIEQQRQESRDQLARILADRAEKRTQRAQDKRHGLNSERAAARQPSDNVSPDPQSSPSEAKTQPPKKPIQRPFHQQPPGFDFGM